MNKPHLIEYVNTVTSFGMCKDVEHNLNYFNKHNDTAYTFSLRNKFVVSDSLNYKPTFV
ncbi:hypothetical protein [Flavivirga eckloniae]|uniref:hypothetical protein n=1 Tax=Flavivirga eckloniae TaxID=1803846 RepID=UPI0013154B0F|nr:hypothetical protein [Flavivirga eckloniae]